jgi:NADH:ubiquinone oxidoreductase subunit 3 (subunit A)
VKLLAEVAFTVIELATAFILILVASLLIYMFGRWLSPKSRQGGASKSTYACGEEAAFPALRVSVSLYRYLVYFVILDSSVLLVAYASLAPSAANLGLFALYLLMMVVSSFLLVGGDDQ